MEMGENLIGLDLGLAIPLVSLGYNEDRELSKRAKEFFDKNKIRRENKEALITSIKKFLSNIDSNLIELDNLPVQYLTFLMAFYLGESIEEASDLSNSMFVYNGDFLEKRKNTKIATSDDITLILNELKDKFSDYYINLPFQCVTATVYEDENQEKAIVYLNNFYFDGNTVCVENIAIDNENLKFVDLSEKYKKVVNIQESVKECKICLNNCSLDSVREIFNFIKNAESKIAKREI